MGGGGTAEQKDGHHLVHRRASSSEEIKLLEIVFDVIRLFVFYCFETNKIKSDLNPLACIPPTFV